MQFPACIPMRIAHGFARPTWQPCCVHVHSMWERMCTVCGSALTPKPTWQPCCVHVYSMWERMASLTSLPQPRPGQATTWRLPRCAAPSRPPCCAVLCRTRQAPTWRPPRCAAPSTLLPLAHPLPCAGKQARCMQADSACAVQQAGSACPARASAAQQANSAHQAPLATRRALAPPPVPRSRRRGCTMPGDQGAHHAAGPGGPVPHQAAQAADCTPAPPPALAAMHLRGRRRRHGV